MMELDIQFFSDDAPLPPTEESTGLEIGTTEIKYTKVYSGNEVTGVIAEVRVPATDNGVSGYVTLGSIEGWTLSEEDTKLTKEYATNQTEIITISLLSFNGITLEDVTTQEVIEIYDIDSSEHIRVTIEYVRENEGTSDKLTSANVVATIKDNYIGSYKFSSVNGEWTISDDKTIMTKTVSVNGTFVNTCAIYPAGEEDSEGTIISENISYSVDNVGLTITEVNVVREEIMSGADVVGVKITATVPYTIGEETGNATLGSVGGWSLSNQSTTLTKVFTANATETITIPVAEANGYSYTSLSFTQEIVVDSINYKKVVKGRCETTMCLYDVYTKAEMDNRLLGIGVGGTNAGYIAVVETLLTTTAENHSINNITVAYPEGFTVHNTWILNARYSDGTLYVTQHLTVLSGPAYQNTLAYSLKDDGIVLRGRLPDYDVGTTIKVQLLLMKVE